MFDISILINALCGAFILVFGLLAFIIGAIMIWQGKDNDK